MTDYQEEKHSSNKLVVTISKENPKSIELIPAFAEGIEKLDVLNKEIEKYRTLQETDITGVTVNKDFTMDNFINYTVDVAGAVYSWADKKNDIILMGIVDFKISKVSKMTPGKIISAAATVIDEARKLPEAELANEGISADELKTYEDMLAYFKDMSISTREATINKSGYTSELATLFAKVSKLYKNTLDRLAHQFKRKDPEYYRKYRAARKVIHHGPGGSKGSSGPAAK